MGALIEHGIAQRAFPGATVSGDCALVEPFSDGILLGAIDGLGHGEPAYATATIAVAALQEHAAENPAALLRRCHQALRGTRGVAMSLASIDARSGTMAWVGVGNVEEVLLRVWASPPTQETLLVRGGVVGYQLPPLHAYRIRLMAGDLLIFATDGIRSDFVAGLPPFDPLLRHEHAEQIADRVLGRFGKTTDDALILVARYLGTA